MIICVLATVFGGFIGAGATIDPVSSLATNEDCFVLDGDHLSDELSQLCGMLQRPIW